MTINAEDLHVIRCYFRLPPLPGGMEKHIAELTAAQRRQGVRVTEIYNVGQPTGDSIRVWPHLALDKIRPSILRWGLFYSSVALRKVDLSDGRIPVLHAHGDWPAYALAAALGRKINAAAVAASLHARFHAPVWRYIWALRDCDPIFTTGRQQQRQLQDGLGREVIHVPSAPAELFFSSPTVSAQAFDVIVVGSLVKVKNLELLLDCARLLPQYRFVVIGDGPERSRVQRLMVEKGLKNVLLRGAASSEDVHASLCCARLYLNTSYSEGSPTAALEAMACGLPVVLTPSNDYSEIVSARVNGIVADGWDAYQLADAIIWFLSDGARLAKATEVSRQIARKHRWDAKAKIVTDAMASAIGERRLVAK